MDNIFNGHLRQIILLMMIIILGVLLITTLYIFLPGFLGGITLYILTRKFFLKLTAEKKWNRWLTALLFIVVSIITIAVPFYFSVQLILPRISAVINNQNEIKPVLGCDTE